MSEPTWVVALNMETHPSESKEQVSHLKEEGESTKVEGALLCHQDPHKDKEVCRFLTMHKAFPSLCKMEGGGDESITCYQGVRKTTSDLP